MPDDFNMTRLTLSGRAPFVLASFCFWRKWKHEARHSSTGHRKAATCCYRRALTSTASGGDHFCSHFDAAYCIVRFNYDVSCEPVRLRAQTATPQAIKEKDIGLAFGAPRHVSRLKNAPIRRSSLWI